MIVVVGAVTVYRMRVAPFLVAAGVALAGLAGCSSGRPGAPAATSIVTITPASTSDQLAVVAAARMTLGTSSKVTFRLQTPAIFGEAAKPISGTGMFDYSASQGEAELVQPTGPERMIFLASSVFAAQTQSQGLLPAGKVWISAGLTEQSLATNFPQFVTQIESLNPALVLSELAWGTASAAPASGPGIPAARIYLAQVDLVKAQAGASGPSAAAFRRTIGYQLAEMSGAAVGTQMSVAVGIDPTGRVVFVQSSPPGAGVGTVTLSLSGFGVNVGVSEPAKAQVADISSLAPGGEHENAGGGDSDGA